MIFFSFCIIKNDYAIISQKLRCIQNTLLAISSINTNHCKWTRKFCNRRNISISQLSKNNQTIVFINIIYPFPIMIYSINNKSDLSIKQCWVSSSSKHFLPTHNFFLSLINSMYPYTFQGIGFFLESQDVVSL